MGVLNNIDNDDKLVKKEDNRFLLDLTDSKQMAQLLQQEPALPPHIAKFIASTTERDKKRTKSIKIIKASTEPVIDGLPLNFKCVRNHATIMKHLMSATHKNTFREQIVFPYVVEEELIPILSDDVDKRLARNLAFRCGYFDNRCNGYILAHDSVRIYDCQSVSTMPGAVIKYQTRFAVYMPRTSDIIEGIVSNFSTNEFTVFILQCFECQVTYDKETKHKRKPKEGDIATVEITDVQCEGRELVLFAKYLSHITATPHEYQKRPLLANLEVPMQGEDIKILPESDGTTITSQQRPDEELAIVGTKRGFVDITDEPSNMSYELVEKIKKAKKKKRKRTLSNMSNASDKFSSAAKKTHITTVSKEAAPVEDVSEKPKKKRKKELTNDS